MSETTSDHVKVAGEEFEAALQKVWKTVHEVTKQHGLPSEAIVRLTERLLDHTETVRSRDHEDTQWRTIQDLKRQWADFEKKHKGTNDG